MARTAEAKQPASETVGAKPYTVHPMDGGPLGQSHEVRGPDNFRSMHGGGRDGGRGAAQMLAGEMNRAFAAGRASLAAHLPRTKNGAHVFPAMTLYDERGGSVFVDAITDRHALTKEPGDDHFAYSTISLIAEMHSTAESAAKAGGRQ